MPKLVQDGVVIMSHNQPQNKHYLFEQDFYPNNLVVKHIDAPSLCPTGHSNESQRNRSGSRSREVLYRESPRHSLTQQYSMQRITDEYNLQGRCKTREMYFENGSKRRSYIESPSPISMGETFNSTKKLFSNHPPQQHSTQHSIDCPNFQFPTKQYQHREYRRESSKNRSLHHARSGFEELDYIINSNIKNNERGRTHRLRSRERSRSRRLSTEFWPNNEQSYKQNECTNLQSRSANVLDNTVNDFSSCRHISAHIDSIPNDSKIGDNGTLDFTYSGSNINTCHSKATAVSEPAAEEPMPVLVPLPIPQFEMPPPPQLFNLGQSSAFPSSEFLNQTTDGEIGNIVENSHINEDSMRDDSFHDLRPFPTNCATGFEYEEKREAPLNEVLTPEKPPKCQLRSPSLNLLDHTNSIDNSRADNNCEKLFENCSDKTSANSSFYSKSLTTNNQPKNLCSENFSECRAGSMVRQSVQTQTEKLEKELTKNRTFNKTTCRNKSMMSAATYTTTESSKTSDTPILDALTALMSSPMNTPMPNRPKESHQVSEYQTSIFIGRQFEAGDVIVNLEINESDPRNVVNKLNIHCRAVDNTECYREIVLPSNVDVKSLESYLDEGNLHFTCQVNNLKLSNSSSSLTTITSQKTSRNDSTSANSNINPLYTLNNHLLNVTMKSLSNTLNTDQNDSCPPTTFENPLYSNSEPKLDQIKTSNSKEIFTSEISSEPRKLGKGISSNSGRGELTSNSYGYISEATALSGPRDEQLMAPLQRGRSYSLPSGQKSVKFDMENNTFHINKEPSLEREKCFFNKRCPAPAPKPSKSNRASYSQASVDLLGDGFNCITKDGLENVFLTYFFKLPACSPSDRTQVRIENHNVLKLKILQEQKFPNEKTKKTKPKCKKFSKAIHTDSSDCSDILSSSEGSTGSSSDGMTRSTESNSSMSFSMPSNTNSSSIVYPGSDSIESDTKIMLREFSRKCKLPNNIFKFDENGITVSFVDNVWVRVEIPILEILGAGLVTNQVNKKILKKKVNKTDKDSIRKEYKFKVKPALVSPVTTNSFKKVNYE